MATSIWIYKGSSWTDPDAFTPAAPGPSDVALFGFSNSTDQFPTVAGNATVGEIVIDTSGATFTGTVDLTRTVSMLLDEGFATFAGGGQLDAAGTVVVGGTAESGQLVLDGVSGSQTIADTGSVLIGTDAATSGPGGALPEVDLTSGQMITNGDMIVGVAATGYLTIGRAGSLTVTKDLIVGEKAAGSGNISISGGRILVDGALRVGGQGVGQLSMGNGSVEADNGCFVGPDGTVVLGGGDLTGLPLVGVSAGGAIIGNGAVVSDRIDNNGTLVARGDLELDSKVSGNGTMEIDQGSTLTIDRSVLGLQPIVFAGSDADLFPGSGTEGPLIGFNGTDALTFYFLGTFSYDSATSTLVVNASDQFGDAVRDTLHFQGLAAGASFATASNSSPFLTNIVLVAPHA